MPPHSKSIFEEGAVFKSFKLVREGVFQEAEVTEALFQPSQHPGSSGTRNLADNLSDLRAQVSFVCKTRTKDINLLPRAHSIHNLFFFIFLVAYTICRSVRPSVIRLEYLPKSCLNGIIAPAHPYASIFLFLSFPPFPLLSGRFTVRSRLESDAKGFC